MTTTQKVLIAAIAASVAVAVGTGVHGTRRMSRMQEESRTLKQQQEPLTEQVQQLRQERDQAMRSLSVLQQENKQLRLRTGEHAKLRDQVAQLQAPAAQASTDATADLFDVKNPAMQEMDRAYMKMTNDKLYGALFKYLNLPADKLDALRDLLMERGMALFNAYESMMSGSESDRKQTADGRKALKSDYDKKIQDLLGSQDYQALQDYEQTMHERFQMLAFKGMLPADAALADQQENDLVTAMYEERKALPASSPLSNYFNGQTHDPSLWTEDRLPEVLKQMEQFQQAYINRAAAILTPAQLEQFTKWLQQQSAMDVAEMKMYVQEYGNKSAPQPPAGNQTQTP
jgi:regulator of replication initiation timing